MTNFIDFPFTTQGINFISRVSTESPILATIMNLPAGIFEQMNIQAVSELLTINANFVLADIQKELDRVNEGGTHAFILLGENN